MSHHDGEEFHNALLKMLRNQNRILAHVARELEIVNDTLMEISAVIASQRVATIGLTATPFPKEEESQ